MQSQTIAATLPTGSFSATQSYGYDNLNRLTQATETGAAGTNWSQGYSYVGNGNRWVSSNTGNPALTLTPETPVTASAYSSSPVVNRINTWTYDNNGNIRVIPIVTNQSRSFTYDAENRAVGATITSLGTTTASYVYDALGQRVSKTVNGQTTTYVYDAFGNLTAEYGAAEASPCGTPTCYVTVDHLGSMRMMTDSSGNPQRLYDYQPFGEELPGGYWGRNTAMGYHASPDDLGPKYTGQSRDPETTLDWFQVRHMSGAQGRFQSVDPGNAGANPADPQTWNMYAYVGNNPMSSTDPSGTDATEIGAALGGPTGAVIGGLVDLGFLLGDLLGAGHTPTLQNFPFPDQVATAMPSAGPSNQLLDSDVTFSDFSDFIAGAGDSLTFGVTRLVRKYTWGGDSTNTCGKAYAAGEWTETGAEIALTLGSGTLKVLAKEASRTAVRSAYRRYAARIGVEAAAGEELHHINPLFGHPGGLPTLFPTGGLPSWIHSSEWNLKSVSSSVNTALHRQIRTADAVGAAAVGPATSAIRIARNAAGGCQ